MLYMVLSDILAERCMPQTTQVRWKGCFTFTGASLADSGLLLYKLVCFWRWLCMLLANIDPAPKLEHTSTKWHAHDVGTRSVVLHKITAHRPETTSGETRQETTSTQYVHVIFFPFRFVFGKERGKLKRQGDEGTERQQTYEQTKQKCHRRWQQPATHARKLAFTSARQQASMRENRNIKTRSKILMNIVARTAGWRSSLINGAH